jgi:hypothetical protein
MLGLDFGFDNIFGMQFELGGEDPRQVVIRNFTYKRFNLQDCIYLDVALKEAKDSLAYLKAKKLNGYKMTLPNQPLFIKESFASFKDYMNTKASDFYKKNTNVNDYYGKYLGDNLLQNVIKTLENKFVDLDCRNGYVDGKTSSILPDIFDPNIDEIVNDFDIINKSSHNIGVKIINYSENSPIKKVITTICLESKQNIEK